MTNLSLTLQFPVKGGQKQYMAIFLAGLTLNFPNACLGWRWKRFPVLGI